MAKANSYSEKLRDPRWQKKRLEILERDGWTCRECFDTESTLVVHHRKYLPGKDPWDYPEKLLITLCEGCHEQERELWPSNASRLLGVLQEIFLASDIQCIEIGFSLLDSKYPPERLAAILQWFLGNKNLLERVCDLYHERTI
jgi:hypothetical protein